MKRIIGILVITVLMSVNVAIAAGTDNAQLDSNQDGSKINLNPKNLPICDSQPYDNCFALLGHYTGEFHNGKYNGLGKYLQQVYTSTSYFIGDFKDDKKNGHFSLYSSENHNKIFEGDFINGMQSEYGIYYYANGDISDSCFLNPFLLCENHWNRRSRDWWNKHNIANLPAKQGAITPKLDHKKYKNGDSYDGEYFNNKPNGQGTYTWRTGEKYVGEFKNGLRNGKGVLYQSNGTLIYSGIWVSPSWEKENALAKTLPPTQVDVNALKTKDKADPYKYVPDGGGYVPKENEVYKSTKLPTYVNAGSEQDSNKSSLNLVAINSNSFLDKNSLQRFGSIVRVWIYVDLTNKPITQWNGPLTNPVYSVRHQEDINCSNKTYQTLELHWYSLPNFTGVEIDTTDVGTTNVLSIPRGSLEDKIYYMFCDDNNRAATEASNANAESANDLTRLQILQQQQILDQQDQQRRIYLLNEAQRLLSPPKSTNCTSTMVGNTVQTNCY